MYDHVALLHLLWWCRFLPALFFCIVKHFPSSFSPSLILWLALLHCCAHLMQWPLPCREVAFHGGPSLICMLWGEITSTRLGTCSELWAVAPHSLWGLKGTSTMRSDACRPTFQVCRGGWMRPRANAPRWQWAGDISDPYLRKARIGAFTVVQPYDNMMEVWCIDMLRDMKITILALAFSNISTQTVLESAKCLQALSVLYASVLGLPTCSHITLLLWIIC